jgi:hypothetical protein
MVKTPFNPTRPTQFSCFFLEVGLFPRESAHFQKAKRKRPRRAVLGGLRFYEADRINAAQFSSA